eukprot:CAMPEP_0178426744 /NCGR_PEP_ID=MMETSP0689_2-20121128/29390_1 /TAXON_ID=160604 /ORGANISM="Amphidinium massartii, Strain CS-259" /LENGTH=79 /DNA_ID=CAMNT_0020048435 /DNA_START=64 /DNA_END=303 /DNA_ORIENTATION=-
MPTSLFGELPALVGTGSLTLSTTAFALTKSGNTATWTSVPSVWFVWIAAVARDLSTSDELFFVDHTSRRRRAAPAVSLA